MKKWLVDSGQCLVKRSAGDRPPQPVFLFTRHQPLITSHSLPYCIRARSSSVNSLLMGAERIAAFRIRDTFELVAAYA